MATKVLTEFKQKLSGMELEPSSGGCFELSLNGENVYSKLETNEFPDEDEIVRLIAGRL